MKFEKINIGLLAFFGALSLSWFLIPEVQFIAGGAMINLGYKFQDGFEHFDFENDHGVISPHQVWEHFNSQNEKAAHIRKRFPRSSRHPLIAMLVCMDARLDTIEISGDTRKNYYVLRTAGSVVSDAELDMLELAVDNGVKVVVLTRHTDCAAEKVAKDPIKKVRYPHLTRGVDERDLRIKEFLARPGISSKIKEGKLLVKELLIDTDSHEANPITL